MFSTPTCRCWIACTRYTLDTFNQRSQWCRVHEHTLGDGMVYPSPSMIHHKVPSTAWVFILDMNNDTNQIEGIGLVRNRVWKQRVPVFTHQHYNRFVYKADHYKPKEDMTDDELATLLLLEQMLFKGKTHLKRGNGITLFPIKFYALHYTRFKEFFCGLFLDFPPPPS